MIKKPYIFVIGNEKGGAGKTTLSMHLISSLLSLGFKVGSLDVDFRQQSLTSYLCNRERTILNKNIKLALPMHEIAKPSTIDQISKKEQEEQQMFAQTIDNLSKDSDFIVIDTPGNDQFLTRHAHSYADTVITPINDSFVDLDIIAKVEADNLQIEKPSLYSQMLWEQKLAKAQRDGTSIDWVIVRNRLGVQEAKNKKNMQDVLQKLTKRIGFRLASGFHERVIFRELFLHGLTLLDLEKYKFIDLPVKFAHISAKQEWRDFLQFLNIKKISKHLKTAI